MLVKTTGTVECFIASANGSFVEIKNSTTGVRESYTLFFVSFDDPTPVTAMWAAMLSAARANGKTVTIQHDQASSKISSVTIGDNPYI